MFPALVFRVIPPTALIVMILPTILLVTTLPATTFPGTLSPALLNVPTTLLLMPTTRLPLLAGMLA